MSKSYILHAVAAPATDFWGYSRQSLTESWSTHLSWILLIGDVTFLIFCLGEGGALTPIVNIGGTQVFTVPISLPPVKILSVYVHMYVCSAVLSIIVCCVTAFINTHLQKSPDLCSIDSTGTPVNQINRPLNVIRRRARDESAGSKLTRIECARTTQREMQN